MYWLGDPYFPARATKAASIFHDYFIEKYKRKVRPGIVNVNSNEPVFYLFSTVSSKCSGSCNSVNYPYAKICIPDVVKNLNVKVFNLM